MGWSDEDEGKVKKLAFLIYENYDELQKLSLLRTTSSLDTTLNL